MASKERTGSATGKAGTTSNVDTATTVPIDPPECGSINTAIEAVRRLFVDYVQYHHIATQVPSQNPARRAAFIKQHGGAYATFQVDDNLPENLCVGIFQQGAHYDAWVRFSSDIPESEPDYQSTVGVGIKLFGVVGPKILEEDAQATTLDLVLQNTPQFFAADAMEMCSFKYANIQSKIKNDNGATFQAWRDAHPQTDQILKEMMKSVASMLTEKLWSCIPYKFGKDQDGNDVYCKFILQNHFADSAAPPTSRPADDNYLSTDLQTRLLNGPIAKDGPLGETLLTPTQPQTVPSTNAFLLDFYVQLRNKPDIQSLTDARVVWDENDSPPIKVAALVIPQQDITVRGQAEYSELLSYSIWRTLPEMAPVGSIAEVRKVVYQSSAQMRRNVNGQPIGEPARPRPPGPPTPPFPQGSTWPPVLTSPPVSVTSLVIAGQRSTTFVNDNARAKVQTLMAYAGQPGMQGAAISPLEVTWKYDDGTGYTGNYFMDTRPDLALAVSTPSYSTLDSVFLAPCSVVQSPSNDAVLLSNEGIVWAVGEDGSTNVRASKALAACSKALAIIQMDDSVQSITSDAQLANELQHLQQVACMAATQNGFATLSTSGAITQQGDDVGGSLPTSPPAFKSITSTSQAYCAIDQTGAIAAWGALQSGGGGVPPIPPGSTCVGVVPSLNAFAALMDDGTVMVWGDDTYGGTGPAGLGNVACVAATAYAYTALKTDGTVVVWGNSLAGGTAPDGLANVVQLAGAWDAFAALKQDGTVVAWGADELVKSLPPSLNNVVSVVAAERAFAALRADGTVVIWGRTAATGSSDPTTWTNIVAIQSAGETIYAVDASGAVHVWGSDANHVPPATVIAAMQNQFSFSVS
jgi:alpha-tubulin suppressor-like RCC1 family protein